MAAGLRRWAIGVLGAVAVVVGLAALVWFVALPRYRPGVGPGEAFAIDISNHQGAIHWEDVASDDIGAVYVKATEGADFTDDFFEANWEGVDDVGLARGAYHFLTLCTSGAEQAAHFIDTIGPVGGDLSIALDLEIAGNCAARPPAGEVIAEIRSFVDLVEAESGRPLLFYIGPDFDDRYGVSDVFDQPAWARRILRRPSDDGRLLWQWGWFGSVDGIDGGVDMNVIRLDRLEALSR